MNLRWRRFFSSGPAPRVDRYCATSSTRRFFARPASSALLAIGACAIWLGALLQTPALAGPRHAPALQQAMRDQDRSAFRNLLDHGANVAEADAHGRTALHLAAMGRDPYWLDALLDRGADPDLPNTITGAPPLFDALRARLAKNVDRLLAGGAHLDTRDRNGTTPLHQAAMVNDPASVLTFLQAGADPRATDNIGKTFQAYLYGGDPDVLNWPTRRSFRKIGGWLRKHGIPITAGILETLQ